MIRRALFCLGCGTTGSGMVPPPDGYGYNGTTLDGTPMPGWCAEPACQAQRARFDATCARIQAELKRN